MKLHPTDEDLSVGTPGCAMDGAQFRILAEIENNPGEDCLLQAAEEAGAFCGEDFGGCSLSGEAAFVE